MEKDRFGDPMEMLLHHQKLIKSNKTENQEDEEEYSEDGRIKRKKKVKKEERKKEKKEFIFDLKCRFKGLPNRLGLQPG